MWVRFPPSPQKTKGPRVGFFVFCEHGQGIEPAYRQAGGWQRTRFQASRTGIERSAALMSGTWTSMRHPGQGSPDTTGVGATRTHHLHITESPVGGFLAKRGPGCAGAGYLKRSSQLTARRRERPFPSPDISPCNSVASSLYFSRRTMSRSDARLSGSITRSW